MRVKETTPGAEQATVEPARLLIADDHPIFRQGLKRIIEDLPDIQLVAEAESGDSALAQLRHLKPDLALIDLAMPGMDGLQVLEAGLELQPELRVIIITSYNDRAYLDRALALGARAYLVKDSAADHLVACIDQVMAGNTYISPTMGRSEVALPSLEEDPARLLDRLTEMERKVLAEVAEFHTSKEIARKMGISYRTVQNHRANIAGKLELRGNHKLVQFARACRSQLT
jgi:DNA-binding NarL/FixJ family response regulator